MRGAAIFTLISSLLVCACKQPPAAPVKTVPQTHEALPEAESAPHDRFALDEQSDDPAGALESMRHNCCDEMPADELRKHTDTKPR
jgi:hypothetical protein